MPYRIVDITGQQFGKLTAIERLPNGKWLCRCSCERGIKKEVYLENLKSGNTQSCGCIKSETRPIVIGEVIRNNRVLEIVNTTGKDGTKRNICICECVKCGKLTRNRPTRLLNEKQPCKGCIGRRVPKDTTDKCLGCGRPFLLWYTYPNGKPYYKGNKQDFCSKKGCATSRKKHLADLYGEETTIGGLVVYYLKAFGEIKSLIKWAKDPRCKVSAHTLRQRIVKRKWDAEKAITTPSRNKPKSKVDTEMIESWIRPITTGNLFEELAAQPVFVADKSAVIERRS